jgi:steroid delta-isomerase
MTVKVKVTVGVLTVVGGLALCALVQAQGGGKPVPVPPAQIRTAMETYVTLLNAGDAEGIMNLFGDNPSVEDPVGGKPVVGREAVRAFYAAAAPGLKGHVALDGRVRVAGLEGAMPMVAELTGARKGFIDVIDTMKFDENGKIVAMRAYWNPGEIRPTR